MDPDDLNSFRPISNLTFLSKIVERVVIKQFTSHAALNGLFPERQSAYRQFHSTDSAVLLFHNDIVCAIDRGEITGLLLTTPHSCRYLSLDFRSQDSHWHGSAHT